MTGEDDWRGVDGPGRLDLLGLLPGLRIFDLTCGMRNERWRGGTYPAYGVVLVSKGGFLYRVDGQESFVDSLSAMVLYPGAELMTAHPLDFYDTSTVLQYDEPPDLDLAVGIRRISDDLYLHHRALVAACRVGIDAFELAERVDHAMAALAAPEREARRSNRTMRHGTREAHRRMVDRALAALLEDGFHGGLDDLADAAGTSRHHLSRVFHVVTGMTVTAYRNRLRVRAVLSDIQSGAPSLRGLASAYGFADQSHLIRVVRSHFGRTPSEVRRLLRAGRLEVDT